MRYNANNVRYNQTKVKYNGVFTSLLEDYSNLTTITTSTINTVPASLISFNIINEPVFATISSSNQSGLEYAETNFGIISFTKSDISNEIQQGQPVVAEIKTINISTMGSQ